MPASTHWMFVDMSRVTDGKRLPLSIGRESLSQGILLVPFRSLGEDWNHGYV